MAGDIKQKFGTSAQALTLTIASLANNALRASTVVDNSSTLYQDALVSVKIKSGAASTAATGYVNVYVYGTADGGTTYSDGATGTDAALTATSPNNLIFLGQINVVANATTYYGGPWSVARAFGGVLPEKWGVVIENKATGTLDTTGGNHVVQYQGVYSQYT